MMTIFVADLVIAAIFFLIIELLILRNRYWIFSPATVFVASFLLLYAFPYFTHEHIAEWPRLHNLTAHEVEGMVHAMRLFFYTWIFAMVGSLWVISRWEIKPFLEKNITLHQKVLVGLFVLFCVVYLVYLGSGIGFSPGAIVDRMLHPRAYTYIKEGFGPILTFKEGLSRTLLFAVMIGVVHRPKVVLFKILLGALILLTILGGSKASMLFPLLFYIMIRQKIRYKPGHALTVKLSYGVVVIVAAVALLFGAFWFYRQTLDTDTTLNETAESMQKYIQEAYMSARIIADYNQDIEYVQHAVLDTLAAPIPRALWQSKPYVGFYRRYWQPRYHPGTPIYHTTTCGCLAEAHMIFGAFGPFVYGLLFAALVTGMQVLAIKARTSFVFLIPVYLNFMLFYLVRVGFAATGASAIVLFFCIAFVLLQVLFPRRTRRYRPPDYRLQQPTGLMPRNH